MADHSRAAQYAVCTWSLLSDRETDGAAAIFDQALSSGLAAIVSRRWPAMLLRGDGKVRSARELLRLIEDEGIDLGSGAWALPHDGPDKLWVDVEIIPSQRETKPDGGPLKMPNFTEVRVGVLCEALDRTQELRHAREGAGPEPLSQAHVDALQELDYDPALFALSDEMIERAEDGANREGREEFERAREYWQMLDDDERARRAQADYSAQVATGEGEGLQDCPVCGAESFVAEWFDSYAGEFGVGACAACSFRRSEAVADNEGLGAKIERL